MGVGEGSATALALVIHELATNSLKYGALSADVGTLDVSGSTDDEHVTLVWTERGGPVVETPNAAPGYGSKLINRSVSGQLGGSISYDWSNEGLIVILKLRSEKLAA
jgi:two-component sensor histidine kinase